MERKSRPKPSKPADTFARELDTAKKRLEQTLKEKAKVTKLVARLNPDHEEKL
jgi:hypothetical protein